MTSNPIYNGDPLASRPTPRPVMLVLAMITTFIKGDLIILPDSTDWGVRPCPTYKAAEFTAEFIAYTDAGGIAYREIGTKSAWELTPLASTFVTRPT